VVENTNKSTKRFFIKALLVLGAILATYEITVYSLVVSQGDQAVSELSSID